ncbi:glutamate--tRNA ligase [Hyphomicrobium methylovorum]|uniref:glutamate--tRNA ligase n=1 Tax=Hyphomicrobium methylovorum TaxID=84 RepID=UPI0015E689B8|nr:glutamate--tRNA ligase [Hyphomicrobium methylovorum]MBA2125112.1 glutamate--tRNA ligase [Hyphomicrobium methylovorum]
MAETLNSDAPVVRFAPSPTGYLHIGGARTALFNWLYARGRGGKFLLRIEDTDRERNNEQAVAAILDGLNWLGLTWDGEAVSQFARADRHREVAQMLLERGAAYYCYASPAEIDAAREKARAEGRPHIFLSPWRDRDPSEAPKDVKPTVRLKAPRDGETIVADHVQGRVVFPNKDLDDLIILRSDGNPTYNLAVVVDDHDMGVSHVVRGADHLTNAGRQTQIYHALDWAVPEFAHVPLIHGADGAKLSKRHGAQGIEEFRAMGYLPEALRNYLVRLGWSHGDDEIISTDDLIRWFDIDDINKSAARLDFKKLDDLNGHYIRAAANEDLMNHAREMLRHMDVKALSATATDPKAPLRSDVALAREIERQLPDISTGMELEARFAAKGWEKFARAIPALKERSKTLADLVGGALFIVAERPLKFEDKAAKLLNDEGRASNGSVHEILSGIEAHSWNASALETAIKSHAEANGLKLGAVAQPLRAALTGRAVSPPVFDVLEILGREESLARINATSA